jgi:hypothetical protein
VGEDLMDGDWSVEIGSDDESLEFPWASPDGSQRYVDLQIDPDRVAEIPEATRFPELGEFLHEINRPNAPWLTAKCDVWLDDEMGETEAIYGAKWKLCSYVDLVVRNENIRFSFERHEQWIKSAARRLSNNDELPTISEFILRRCWYHTEASALRAGDNAHTPGKENLVPGFYVTFYLFGYGVDESQARASWAEGLRQVTAALSSSAI